MDQVLASSSSSGEPGEIPFHRQVSWSLPITRIAPAEGHLRRTHHHPAIDDVCHHHHGLAHRVQEFAHRDLAAEVMLDWQS
jgi:hypothetical protein